MEDLIFTNQSFSFQILYLIPTISLFLYSDIRAFLCPLQSGVFRPVTGDLKLHVVLKRCVVCLECGL